MTTNAPPPEVAAAAAVVDAWLRKSPPVVADTKPTPQGGRVSDEQYARMTPAQKLDYARQFDQRQFQKN